MCWVVCALLLCLCALPALCCVIWLCVCVCVRTCCAAWRGVRGARGVAWRGAVWPFTKLHQKRPLTFQGGFMLQWRVLNVDVSNDEARAKQHEAPRASVATKGGPQTASTPKSNCASKSRQASRSHWQCKAVLRGSCCLSMGHCLCVLCVHCVVSSGVVCVTCCVCYCVCCVVCVCYVFCVCRVCCVRSVCCVCVLCVLCCARWVLGALCCMLRLRSLSVVCSVLEICRPQHTQHTTCPQPSMSKPGGADCCHMAKTLPLGHSPRAQDAPQRN